MLTYGSELNGDEDHACEEPRAEHAGDEEPDKSAADAFALLVSHDVVVARRVIDDNLTTGQRNASS